MGDRCASRRVAVGWVRGAGKGVGVAQSPVTVEPVHPGFDAAVLEDLGRRLSAVRLAPGGGTGWEQGVPRPSVALGGDLRRQRQHVGFGPARGEHDIARLRAD